VQIKDLLGFSEPAKRLIDAIERGVGQLFEPWQRARRTQAEVNSFNQWSKALQETGLNIAAADLSLAERASVRVIAQESRRQQNREAIAAGAVLEFTHTHLEKSSDVESKLEIEWIDRFWRIAQDVSDETFQSLWARVLARQCAGSSKCSPRCLEALSLLNSSEAKSLERIATMTMLAEAEGMSKSVILLSVSDYRTDAVPAMVALGLQHANRRIVDYVGDLHPEIFGPIGIFIDDGWGHELPSIVQHQTVSITIGQQPYDIKGYPPKLQQIPRLQIANGIYIGTGTQLTPLGSEIISLIQAEPDKEYVKLLGDALACIGLSLAPQAQPSRMS
jgi:hypothetical protein